MSDSRKTPKSRECNELQPFIILVGETPDESNRFYIFINDILYETESFLKALSITYQMHFILNIEYAKECTQVWYLIQDFFYNMPLEDFHKTSAFYSLSNQLK